MRIATLLIVDDDTLILRALARRLGGAGKHVVTAENPQRARDLSRSEQPEVAIVDLLLGPDGVQGGLGLVRQLRSERDDLVVIAYSAAMTPDLATFATEAGANRVARKDLAMLRGVLDRLESGAPPLAQVPPWVPSLDEVERCFLDCVVHAYGGLRPACRALHMHRSTLRRKLRTA